MSLIKAFAPCRILCNNFGRHGHEGHNRQDQVEDADAQEDEGRNGVGPTPPQLLVGKPPGSPSVRNLITYSSALKQRAVKLHMLLHGPGSLTIFSKAVSLTAYQQTQSCIVFWGCGSHLQQFPSTLPLHNLELRH